MGKENSSYQNIIDRDYQKEFEEELQLEYRNQKSVELQEEVCISERKKAASEHNNYHQKGYAIITRINL